MSSENTLEKKEFQIYGMPWHIFAIFSAIVLIAVYMGKLPKGMIGAFPVMIVLGTILGLAGDKAPIVKTFLGGGAIVVIFGVAAITTNFGTKENPFYVIPEATVSTMRNFTSTEGYLDFYIAALITGSILSMNRKLLIKAAVRYIPALLGGVALSLGLCALFGTIIGYGGTKALLYIAVPIMGGGMGAGAVPLSQVFGKGLNVDPTSILSIMIPAVALGNALSIVAGGLLKRLGTAKPSLTGGTGIDSQLMKAKGAEAELLKVDPDYQKARESLDLIQMGTGLLMATSFFAFGSIINKFVPSVHGYAWMILTVAVIKALGIMPQKLEISAYQWFQFVMKNLTFVLLVGIGVAYTDLKQIAMAFSFEYLLLVFIAVIGAIVGSGLVGWLVGFYPIDSAITAGLCMANMGGTGDVAVLSAADRMELMPFAQISSRIGGAMMLILASILLPILG